MTADTPNPEPATEPKRAKWADETPCPNAAKHTPHPKGYVDHATWGYEMLRTHRQVRCAGCGLWAIWVPKKKRVKS